MLLICNQEQVHKPKKRRRLQPSTAFWFYKVKFTLKHELITFNLPAFGRLLTCLPQAGA